MPQNLYQKYLCKKWLKFCAQNIFESNGSRFLPKLASIKNSLNGTNYEPCFNKTDIIACFIYFSQKFSVLRGTEISVVRPQCSTEISVPLSTENSYEK